MLTISCAQFFPWLVVLVSIGAAGSVEAQEVETRMVIGANAVCRAAPNPSASVVHSYLLGELVHSTRESREEGEDWYFDQWGESGQSSACWVYGPLTTEFVRSNPEPALMAVVDHILHRADSVRFEDYIAVDNLLTYDYPNALYSSGLLQFRRLSIIKRAVSLPTSTRRLVAKDPLMRAWFLSRRDLLTFFEPAGRWFLEPETYWDLYEKYKQAPWAEELAWAAAQLSVPRDECYADCVLKVIHRTYQQYWTRFPHGASINEAIGKAAARAKYASQMVCYDVPVTRPFLDEMRASLAGVTAPGKHEILRSLNDLEQAQGKCRR
jgi:hypothetical protein